MTTFAILYTRMHVTCGIWPYLKTDSQSKPLEEDCEDAESLLSSYIYVCHKSEMLISASIKLGMNLNEIMDGSDRIKSMLSSKY